MKARELFFDAARTTVFGGRVSQAQVDGCNAIFDSCGRHNVTDDRHVANILAQVFHETGRYMLPIKETVMPHHQDKNPSDTTVIQRLETAFAAGRLPWVKTPYWRDGWFGRGPIQLTHRTNYEAMGRRLGVDLVGNRNLALDPKIGADIAVVGMSEGRFRSGHSLSTYFNDQTNNAPGARRIVNGPDGTDATVATYHAQFLSAIRAAGGAKALVQRSPAPAAVAVAAGATAAAGGAAYAGPPEWVIPAIIVVVVVAVAGFLAWHKWGRS